MDESALFFTQKMVGAGVASANLVFINVVLGGKAL